MPQQPHPRLPGWKKLWKTDPAAAGKLCDAIARDRDVPERLLTAIYGDSGEDFPEVTRRQIEIGQLLADDLEVQMAAEKLGISFHTARQHVRRLHESTNTHTNAGAVAYLMRKGLIR